MIQLFKQNLQQIQVKENYQQIQKKTSRKNMDELIKQNEHLKDLQTKFRKQINDLQQVNMQHETQIDTLLKFNQKLLNIIQKQLNGQKLKKSDMLSLQPISQKTQIQSQMFQSQFSNVALVNMANVGNKLLQKKSLNLRPDPTAERIGRPEPLAIVEKQEQLSIDVDYTVQKQSQDQDHEINSLIKQFKRKIKIKQKQNQKSGGNINLNASNANQYTIQEVEQRIKSQSQELTRFKKSAIQDINSKLYRIRAFKQSIVNEIPRDKITQILQGLEDTDEKSKEIIKNYIQSM